MNLIIGSGNTTALLSGLNTKGHHSLLEAFVSNITQYRNAKASPVDALRTGAILEDRYHLTLSDDYYAQHKATCKELSALRSSLDFAKIDKGEVVDFEELKTCSLLDFLEFEKFRDDGASGVEYIKKKYKNYYNQVQFQLLCTGLESATMVFLAVYTYEDEINLTRDIKPNEIIKFSIQRDEKVIELITKRAAIFQQIKDYYTN